MGKFQDFDPLKGIEKSGESVKTEKSGLVRFSPSSLLRRKKEESSFLQKKTPLETAKEFFKKAEKRKKSSGKILILIDATGSMSAFWDETKKILKDLIQRIEEICGKGNFHLKIVAYRDYCDGNKILEPSEWSDNAGELFKFADKIGCTGGGDEPEAIEKALELANQEQELGRIILIGDAPPHEQKDYFQQAQELGKKQQPVFAFYVAGSNSLLSKTKPAFERIAQASGGKAAPLKNAKEILDLVGVAVVESVGGKDALERYLKKYPVALGSGAQELAQKLLK